MNTLITPNSNPDQWQNEISIALQYHRVYHVLAMQESRSPCSKLERVISYALSMEDQPVSSAQVFLS